MSVEGTTVRLCPATGLPDSDRAKAAWAAANPQLVAAAAKAYTAANPLPVQVKAPAMG